MAKKKNTYGRNSLPGVNMKGVKLYPNGKNSADKTVAELSTIGIKLIGTHQITDFVTSIMEMHKAGHQEINITGWLKKGHVTFLGGHVDRAKTGEKQKIAVVQQQNTVAI